MLPLSIGCCEQIYEQLFSSLQISGQENRPNTAVQLTVKSRLQDSTCLHSYTTRGLTPGA